MLKDMKVIKDILLHPWYRLTVLCVIGLVLMGTSGSGGYMDQTTTQAYIGIAFFIGGILTVPAQWLIEWIASW